LSAIPPVSVCLLTYNRADLLPKTVESLLAQSFSDFEFIISDDCSSDNTEEICREYARRDARIRYLRNDRNLGMPGNLNLSLQVANGFYLANLHDGDVYRHDLITKWKNALDNHPTAGFVFNAYRLRREDGSEIIYKDAYPSLIPGRELGARLLSRWDSCVFGTVMARREIYERLGWFDPRFGNYSDVDMWIRIAREYDAAYVNEPLIDLMPKDKSRSYSFVHWEVLFWLMGIQTMNLRRYQGIQEVSADRLMKDFPRRARALLLRSMLICLKHRRWDRAREGFAIWLDSEDDFLRFLGKAFGNRKDLPDWYHPDMWQTTKVNSA